VDAHQTCCVGLKTTREVSPGQHVFGPLISAPQFHQYPLQSGDELLILASNGLWDKVDSKAAVREARRHLALEATTPAQVLVSSTPYRSSDDSIQHKLLGVLSRVRWLTKGLVKDCLAKSVIKPACGDSYRVVL